MKKNFLVILVFFVLNCAKTDYYIRNTDSKVRMTSFSQEEGYVLKRRFEVSHTRVNMFWGLVNVYKKDLESILLPEFKNYEKEAVGNLTITETYDFLDSLVDFILIGIVRPYSVVLQGNLYEKVSEPTQQTIEEDKERNKTAQPATNDKEQSKTTKSIKEGTNVKKK